MTRPYILHVSNPFSMPVYPTVLFDNVECNDGHWPPTWMALKGDYTNAWRTKRSATACYGGYCFPPE